MITKESANSLECLYQAMEHHSLMLTQARTIAAIGVDIDCSSYDNTLLSDFWGVMFGLIEQAENSKQEVLIAIKNLAHHIKGFSSD